MAIHADSYCGFDAAIGDLNLERIRTNTQQHITCHTGDDAATLGVEAIICMKVIHPIFNEMTRKCAPLSTG